MALIGRRLELAAVERLLDRAAAGAGGHLLVTGPAGAGKSALLAAAGRLATERGIPVLRHRPRPDGRGFGTWDPAPSGLGVWASEAEPAPDDTDRAAAALTAGGPRLLLADDADSAPDAAARFLALLASRAHASATVLLTAARRHPGTTAALRLGGLSETDLAALAPGLAPDAVHALWLTSGGLPGVALDLLPLLADPAPAAVDDPVARLALTVPSRAEFLDLDIGLIRLLETAADHPLPPEVRARVVARLARELLGDASAAARRRELIEEAVDLARSFAGPGPLAEVLDHRLHALWDPAAAHERLDTASEIVVQARRAGDAETERRGLFWRFVALAELGELGSAEAALTAYARAGEPAGDAEAAVVVLARRSMLALVRGRFAESSALAREMTTRGRATGLADTDRLAGTLRAASATLTGDLGPFVEPWLAMAGRLPGHFFEASAARAMVETGRGTEAGLELERLLPAVLAGSGPRWLGVAADLAAVAARVGDPAAARALYEVLLPYRGRLVVWGGANTIAGPVDDCLGRLAARLGRPADALGHLDAAVATEERIGALPWLAHTLAARADAASARGGVADRRRADDDRARARSIAERLGMDGFLAALAPPADTWRLARDGDDWLLHAGGETARLRDGRGVAHLRALLAVPGQEVPALDLVAGGAGLRVPGGDPVLDDTARTAYRRRLETLAGRLDAADRAGDTEKAAAVEAERTALLAELRRATGLGGRPRTQAAEAERARVNATRALWNAVRRVEAAAPLAGAHLRQSLRTGRFFRYQPGPGGPARWDV